MARFGLAFVLGTVFLSALVLAATPLPEPKEKVTEKDIRSEIQAWQYSGIDLADGQTLTITASGSWKTNPGWLNNVGAGGESNVKANDNYLKPGASPGCLLVRMGDEIRAFASDDEAIVIKKPGKIYFCANDEPTQGGATRFKELQEGKNAKAYEGWLPVVAPKGLAEGAGYLDNVGTIHVRLAVTRTADK